MPPGHACCPSRQGSRRVRPLPPRQARPRAYRSRHGGGAGPACCARAFRVSKGCEKRGLGQAAAHIAGPCLLSQPAREPPRAPAPAAAGASPRLPLAPWGRGWPGMLRASVSSVQRMRETRLGAGGGAYRRAMLVVPAGKGAAARARSCRGRRVPAPTARAVRPHQPRNPHRASVSSVLPTQETRLGAGGGGCRRALRPHQPSEVWRAAALQNVFVSPGFAGRAGSLRPWAQTFLTPAAARRAGGKAAGEVGGRRDPAEKTGASRAFPTRSYSILASASLTSSIRRATWEGVSTGWLNSTVWFTVTGAAACVCAASRS